MSIERELQKMQEMRRNFERYGIYATDDKMPPVVTKSELYKRLKIDGHFYDIQNLFDHTEQKVRQLQQDPRYTDAYKKEGIEAFYRQFNTYKDHKWQEIQKELLKYKEELKVRFAVEEPNSTDLNNLLIQLQFIDGIDNNGAMIENFLNENMNSSVIRGLIQAKYGEDNPNIKTSISNYEKEQNAPFTVVDQELRMVETFINNTDYLVDKDYLKNEKLTEFREVRGAMNRGNQTLEKQHNQGGLRDDVEGQEVPGKEEN